MTGTAVATELAGFAFPGQGNKIDQTVDALRTHSGHPVVAEFLSRFAPDGPEELDLTDTSVSQPATYAAGIASAESASADPAAVPVVLGHSLGELTAAGYGGVVDVWDGFALAVRRGEICRERQLASPGRMIAVMGTDLAGIEWLRRQAVGRTGGVLEVAGYNGSRQTVLSGDVEAVGAAVKVAAELGVLAEVLPIGGSFHSPLMLDAVPPWREAVEAVEFREPATTFVSTVDAQVHGDPVEIRELLVRALLMPVRWLDATHTVRALGVPALWDAGPATTLGKLGRREGVVKFVGRPELTQAAAMEANQ